MPIQAGEGGLGVEVGGKQLFLVAVEKGDAVVDEFVEIEGMLAEEFETGSLAFEGNVDGTVGFRVEVEVEGVGQVTGFGTVKGGR